MVETRQEYLISFLRQYADEIEHPHDAELMREAADEFEAAFPKAMLTNDPVDELHFNLIRAEMHARQAYDLVEDSTGPKRSLWYRTVLGQAQSILMSLYKQEMRRKGNA